MVVLGMGFPGGSDGKESTCDAGDPGSPLGREDPLEKGMAIFMSGVCWVVHFTGGYSFWNLTCFD